MLEDFDATLRKVKLDCTFGKNSSHHRVDSCKVYFEHFVSQHGCETNYVKLHSVRILYLVELHCLVANE